MYKIIGGDQKEYGPVTPDELRRWIAEGRLNGQSRVRLEGQTDWQPLSEFPEFADALAAQVAPAFASIAAGVAAPVTLTPDQILEREPQVQVMSCLARSWQLLRSNFGLLFGACLIYWAIQFVFQLNIFSGFIYAFFHGVFGGGLYLVFLKRIRGQPAVVTDVFSGFKVAFGQLILAGFISQFLAGLGCCACIIPGIYLFFAWVFSVPLVADQPLEFWSAMELSRKVVTRVWFEVFGLVIMAFLPFIVVSMIIQVIVATTSPPMAMPNWSTSNPPDLNRMLQEVFRMITESSHNRSPLLYIPQFALLLNLPFAVGALMYAYENLFGPRPAQTT
jgi:hypothetical protein